MADIADFDHDAYVLGGVSLGADEEKWTPLFRSPVRSKLCSSDRRLWQDSNNGSAGDKGRFLIVAMMRSCSSFPRMRGSAIIANITPEKLFPQPGHDHGHCVEAAVMRARTLCAEKSVRLTPLREAVLRVLLSAHRALGAYDIIDLLKQDGRQLAPISVYRVVDVLLEAGLVHRLESRNAFFACLAEHDDTRSLLVLVCEKCARVAEAEAPSVWGEIKSMTQSNGFDVSETVLEIKGVCADCREQPWQAA